MAAPSPAATAPPAKVDTVHAEGDTLTFRVHALDLPADRVLGPEDVQVRLDGRPVPVAVTPVQDERAASVRRVAIVFDTSGSMAGQRMEAARDAANRYLDLVPPDVEVGLVSFAAQATVRVTPTLDRQAVRAAVAGLVPDGGTSLYDGIALAGKTLGDEGQRRVLVLSDGEDTRSSATLEEALSTVTTTGVAVDAVVLGEQPAAATAVLQRLTVSGPGHLLQARDSRDASGAFASAATAFTSGLQVKLEVPQDLAGEQVTLKVYVRSTKGLVAGESSAKLPGHAGSSPLAAGPTLAFGLGATFLGLFGLLVLAVRSGDSTAVGRRRTEEVLASYSLTPSSPVADVPLPSSRVGDSGATRMLLVWAGAVLRVRGLGPALELRLDRAGLKFTPAEWLVIHGLLVLTTGLVVTFVASLAIGFTAGVVVGLGVHFYVGIHAGRRQKAFTEDIPDALQLIASGLASGYSLPQALDAVVNEGSDPLASEFGRALAEARVGVPLEDALDKVADRMASEDFRWVVMAVRVQRDVGGNLSEVLTTITNTMRERGALRRQVRALSAEGRLGALILIALPILVSLYLATFSGDFFQPMLVTMLGNLLLAGCSVALALGALWMKKIVKVEM